jgi:hypothetical protein
VDDRAEELDLSGFEQGLGPPVEILVECLAHIRTVVGTE